MHVREALHLTGEGKVSASVVGSRPPDALSEFGKRQQADEELPERWDIARVVEKAVSPGVMCAAAPCTRVAMTTRHSLAHREVERLDCNASAAPRQ